MIGLFIVLVIIFRGATWRTIMIPLVVAFLFRFFVTIYYRFVGDVPGVGSADAIKFEGRAWVWAQSGCGNLGEHLNLGASYVHSWILANIYACTGREPLVFQMINVGLGVLTVYLIARIAEELWDRQAALRAAWFAALFPIFITTSAVPLREVWFTAPFLFSILLMVRWVRTRRMAYLAAAVFMNIMAAVIHGIAVFALLAVGLVLTGWGLRELARGMTSGRVKAGVLVASLTLVGLLVLGITQLGELRFSSIGQVGVLHERIDSLDERAYRARGGSAFPSYLVPSNEIEMAVLTPVRMVYVLFGPPPWEIRSVFQIIGALDGLIYFAMVFLLVRYREVWWSRREFRLLLVVFLALAVVLAWGVNNFGAGTRHRAKFVGILIAMAAGFIGRRRWRKERLLNIKQTKFLNPGRKVNEE